MTTMQATIACACLLLASVAVAQEATKAIDGMGEDTRSLATQLFHLLVMLATRGKPVPILMGIERGNGFAAYLALKREYEPKVGGRHAAI